MAWEKQHFFFKTSLTGDRYDTNKIVQQSDYNYEHDDLTFISRRNGLRQNLIEIFNRLKCSFDLDFLLNNKEFSYEDFDKTQIIFTLPQQIKVINSINALYTAINNHQLTLYGDNVANWVHDAKYSETSKLDCEYNDTMREAVWTLELIRRFFEQSIKQKKIIVKYESN